MPVNSFNPEEEPPPASSAPTRSKLTPCPDCGINISRHAESCPHCGRFIQSCRPRVIAVEKEGWISTIAWGIILAWLIPIIFAAIALIVLIVFFGGLASMVPRR